MESEKLAILGTILGTIVGIIGTLITQFFSISYDKEKNKQQESRKIIENKYKNFKELYKKYKYNFIPLLDYNYNIILKKFDIFESDGKKKNIDLLDKIDESYTEYIKALENIMEFLDEDYYITKDLINYDELKDLFFDILKKRSDLIWDTLLFKTTINEVDKSKIQKEDENFINICKTMHEQLVKLNEKLQKLLYKDVVKSC